MRNTVTSLNLTPVPTSTLPQLDHADDLYKAYLKIDQLIKYDIPEQLHLSQCDVNGPLIFFENLDKNMVRKHYLDQLLKYNFREQEDSKTAGTIKTLVENNDYHITEEQIETLKKIVGVDFTNTLTNALKNDDFRQMPYQDAEEVFFPKFRSEFLVHYEKTPSASGLKAEAFTEDEIKELFKILYFHSSETLVRVPGLKGLHHKSYFNAMQQPGALVYTKQFTNFLDLLTKAKQSSSFPTLPETSSLVVSTTNIELQGEKSISQKNKIATSARYPTNGSSETEYFPVQSTNDFPIHQLNPNCNGNNPRQKYRPEVHIEEVQKLWQQTITTKDAKHVINVHGFLYDKWMIETTGKHRGTGCKYILILDQDSQQNYPAGTCSEVTDDDARENTRRVVPNHSLLQKGRECSLGLTQAELTDLTLARNKKQNAAVFVPGLVNTPVSIVVFDPSIKHIDIEHQKSIIPFLFFKQSASQHGSNNYAAEYFAAYLLFRNHAKRKYADLVLSKPSNMAYTDFQQHIATLFSSITKLFSACVSHCLQPFSYEISADHKISLLEKAQNPLRITDETNTQALVDKIADNLADNLATKQSEKLAGELETVRQRAAVYEQEKNILYSEVMSINDKLKDASSTSNQTLSRVEELEGTIDELNQNTVSKRQFASIESGLANSVEQTKFLRDDIDNTKTLIENLQESAKGSYESVNTLSQQLSKLNSQINLQKGKAFSWFHFIPIIGAIAAIHDYRKNPQSLDANTRATTLLKRLGVNIGITGLAMFCFPYAAAGLGIIKAVSVLSCSALSTASTCTLTTGLGLFAIGATLRKINKPPHMDAQYQQLVAAN